MTLILWLEIESSCNIVVYIHSSGFSLWIFIAVYGFVSEVPKENQIEIKWYYENTMWKSACFSE